MLKSVCRALQVYDTRRFLFREALPNDMIMFTLKHKSFDIVLKDKHIEAKIWQFFLDVMPTLELSQYLLDLCSYAISGIRDQHFFYHFRGRGG
jgi:hypothetical protein